ncbi:hypothetical protein NKH14_13690 [Mesorhizobium sp. M1380]|uniref:hypothetical protein n=1 Tax=Mesorhizobium sp. M1380 TaxID=2957093 RepID=UPI00333A6FF8
MDMPEPQKDRDQEKGDEVLRRLLKTPPAHRAKPKNADAKAKKQNKSAKSEQKGDD